MRTRRTFLQLGAAVSLGGLIRWQLDPTSGYLFGATQAFASVEAPQIPLASTRIPRFVEALPTFLDRRVSDTSIHVRMSEFQQKVLPDQMYTRLAEPFRDGTYLWGFGIRAGDDEGDEGDNESDDGNSPTWPGRTIVAQQGRPTTVIYRNTLSARAALIKYLTIDQTLHWANPLHHQGGFEPFDGAIPTVVHLHGGEVPSGSDGAPEAWFTRTGQHGSGYFTSRPTAPRAAVYRYPNDQPAATLWVHDHALGVTRTNVYSGLAGFYLVRDRFDTGRLDNPLRLPANKFEVEPFIQDRQFDTNGQLLFPDSTANPSLVDGPPGSPLVHPFWIPEFFGDAIVVNGRTWPRLQVEPRRYRFRILNASNARFLRMGLAEADTSALGPPLWQIGTDGGLMDRPMKFEGRIEPPNQRGGTRLFIGPGERADVIVDFSTFPGRTLILTNDAQVPFDSGAPLSPGDPSREIMQFRVGQPQASRDLTFDPSTGGALRGGPNQDAIIVRLVEPTSGTLGAGVQPSVRRQLILFESDVRDLEGFQVGPTRHAVEHFINNTGWSGLRPITPDQPVPGSQADAFGQGLWMTELPRVGSTEVWEILNLTQDAHPIHLHLVQFQVLNRQAAIVDQTGVPVYVAAYTAQFPGGTFIGVRPDGTRGPVSFPPGKIIPGYGPPNRPDIPNADGALGGNPAFRPFVAGPPLPPPPGEYGWKDTVKAFPRFVTRFVVRWAPTSTPLTDVHPGNNRYSFDPTRGPGYALHCHMLDHEDNEMMRPYLPVP
jgi:spore coat protein A, manganese oxidase